MADKTKAQLEEELTAATERATKAEAAASEAAERAERAEQDLEDANEAVAELEEANGKLKAELEATDRVDPAAFAENQEALRLQEEMNTENEERIADLEAQVAKLSHKQAEESPAANLPRVTVDDEVFQITVARFRYKGRKYTAEELSEDEDLILELLEVGAGILKPL